MARATLTAEALSDAGVVTAAKYTTLTADGAKVANANGRIFLHIKAVTAATVTIQTGQTVSGLAVADRTIALLANQDAVAGPFPTTLYNQADGTLYIDSNQLDTSVLALKTAV